VFTSGGIGPTHDDVTVSAVAEAFGRRVVTDDRILTMLRSHYGEKLNAARKRLAEVPEGADVHWPQGASFPTITVENVAMLPGPPMLFKEGFGRLREQYRAAPLYGRAIYVSIGEGALAEPENLLDLGNSGTAARLLLGMLATHPITAFVTGDASLRRRPMGRVVEPLREMGAKASWPPLRVGGHTPLHGIEYQMPIPSAQVKSAILLAGLFADGTTAVIEPVRTRDHTEVMLGAMGVEIRIDGLRVAIDRAERLEPLDMTVPGDFSSAAFWLVAGGLVGRSDVRLLGVGMNPTRTCFAETLTAAGFHIKSSKPRLEAQEVVADLEVRYAAQRRPFQIDATLARAQEGAASLTARERMHLAAATAWQHLLGCPTFNDKVFDAIRAFRAQYVNKGPESIPYPE